MALHDTSKPSSSQSSHRLPTVSASQALQSLKDKGPRAVSTGLHQLDVLLSPRLVGPHIGSSNGSRGLMRGQVTEIYGPPGVGKTAFGLQACKTALLAGGRVVWIDAASPVARPRLKEIMSTSRTPPKNGLDSSGEDAPPVSELLGRFHRYFVPTLAHLLALFIHPTTSFPPEDTALIVIDSVSTLFDYSYPRTGGSMSNRTDDAKWAAGRRYAVMNELISKLGKMAALCDIPILLTNQTVTHMRPGLGALLMPAMAGMEWDNGIATRLVLFRDWPPESKTLAKLEEDRRKRVRFIGVVKVGGVAVGEAGGMGAVVPFTIENSELSDIDLKSVEVPMQPLTSPSRPTKRTYTEIADSEDELGSDELYGWDEQDEIAAEGLIDEAALAAHLAEDDADEPPAKKRASDQERAGDEEIAADEG